jgi:formylglycine-generating enzyme required for sulfatase activity
LIKGIPGRNFGDFFVTKIYKPRFLNQILQTMRTALLILSFIAIATISFVKPKKPITTLSQMKKTLGDGYAYVPSGNLSMDDDTVSVQGFFMLKAEVSNFHYREFLFSLKQAGKLDEYQAALPDTTAWRQKLAFNEKYVEYYFNHPAYREYPVVNITKAQAEQYCKWLTQIWREKTGNHEIIFRLPYRAEFLKAAYGNSLKRTYAWGSPFLLNEKGQPNCNFLNIGAGVITRDSITGALKIASSDFDALYQNMGPHADLMAPVKSYLPNEFDIYNLNGNVSEMIIEENTAVGGNWNSPGYDVCNESTETFLKANPMVGFRPVMTFVEKK